MVFSVITSGVTATSPSLTGLYVGTSGFSYPSWKPGFYPPSTRPDEFLRRYAERLPSVELNATFYDLPAEERFAHWAEQTPPGFRFAVKAHRSIAHFGRLELLPAFCERAARLGERLGPILIQFPPNRPRDDGILRLFLDSLDPRLRYAFELRDESWDVDDVLAEARVARVGSLEGTAAFRYLRLRDPPYEDAALDRLATKLVSLIDGGVAAYCYFKHEEAPTAPAYAEALIRRVQSHWR
jgi:uncharacterized protein YecE (DUF72 family)